MVQIPLAHSCPFCNSPSFKKNGKYKDAQRYKCHNCARSFKDTTNTALHWLHHKTKIVKYFDALHTGLSVRKAAAVAGICKNTSFNWRHKFLASLHSESDIKNKSNAVTNLGLLTLPYSQKGRRKLPEKDNSPRRSVLINHHNQIKIVVVSTKHPVKHIAQEFLKIKPAIVAVVESKKLLARALQTTEGVNKLLRRDLEDLEKRKTKAVILNLQIWLDRFRGVASKYLQQYWNWYSALNNFRYFKTEKDMLFRLFVTGRAYADYRMLKAA